MTFSELFPQTIYMNLDERPDRKKLVEKEFKKLGISPDRMNGVVITGMPNKILNGAVGCMLAHIVCLQRGQSNNNNIFIFEDDIKFVECDNLKQQIDACCNELNSLDWDMFYLSANILKPFRQVTEHLAKLNHAQSTVAYGVNKNFIQKLLSYLPYGRQITQPWIDVIYADAVIPNHNCFISVPMFGVQRNDYSNILSRNVEYEGYLQTRYNKHLIKMDIK